MEVIVTLVVAGLLVALCLVVLARRSRGSSGDAGSHGPSGAELDAQSRAASQRGSDRQGMGPG